MLQHVKRPDLHIEPEDNTLKNDNLELENSECLSNYGVQLEKIYAPGEPELHGYFMLSQPKYDGYLGSSWHDNRYWRYYKAPFLDEGAEYWFRLEIDESLDDVYKDVKSNLTKTANEYLFIVLEEEMSDETRCTLGKKPKVAIVPKLVRYQALDKPMFITWKSSALKQLDTYSPYGHYSEFYLHDCQGKPTCPGCHSVTHKPETVDGRKCPA